MGRAAGGNRLPKGSVFSSADLLDAANDNEGRLHAPWRRFVAAGLAAIFALTLVLIGLVCTTHAAEPASSPAPSSFART